MQSSIAAGALLPPASDNALTHFGAMRSLSRSHALTVAAQRDLRAALLSRASQATQQHQFDVATRYLGAAGELGGSSEVTDARRQLQEEMDRAARAQQAATAASAEPAPPAPVAPPTPTPAAPSFIAAIPVRPLDVSYPPFGRGIEGHVIVEFTLHANGAATDPIVIESQPHGLFDRVAIAAVRRGQYQAGALAGAASRRARISLHFKPE